MVVRFTVLAHKALAFLSALHARPETFTIVFPTLRFFTGASTFRHECRYSLEGPGVAKVCHLLGLVDVQFVSGSVAATRAFATLVAHPSLGETFAIHLETGSLFARASSTLLLC